MKEKKAKRTPDIADLLIAATAEIYGMRVATLNRKHFEPLEVSLADL
jgi:predicted nucleic acid-binding protein